jgi:DnaJ-class molecular chaperone
MRRDTPIMPLETAMELLGVAAAASEAEIRAAYLEQVRRHPPDRDPERFEQIRDAYNCLRDPTARARLVLEGPDPSAPLASILQKAEPRRCFVGSQLWMGVLVEKRP